MAKRLVDRGVNVYFARAALIKVRYWAERVLRDHRGHESNQSAVVVNLTWLYISNVNSGDVLTPGTI